jgi:hypothetical protein
MTGFYSANFFNIVQQTVQHCGVPLLKTPKRCCSQSAIF